MELGVAVEFIARASPSGGIISVDGSRIDMVYRSGCLLEELFT